MTQTNNFSGVKQGRRKWRIAGWGLLMLLLLVPWVAMQFTSEVNWTASDFALMGVMLLLVGLGLEAAVRLSDNMAYRAGFALAVLSAFLLVWANLAVGLIGSEDNLINIWYMAVLGVGLLGAIIARYRPRGMAMTLVAMAVVQALIGLFAMASDLGEPASGALEIAMITGFFMILFLGSAALFHQAHKHQDTQTLETVRLIAIIVSVIGLAMLAPMIVIEGEPGFIPLATFVVGLVCLTVVQFRIRAHHRSRE